MKVLQRLAVVHECEKCLAVLTPAESGQVVNVSGIIECRSCGHRGPLRVRVVETTKGQSSS